MNDSKKIPYFGTWKNLCKFAATLGTGVVIGYYVTKMTGK
tara:strand:+ start:1563 stop:1682 length:120 start_codon:yes stop_codon:yes gene_type:complete